MFTVCLYVCVCVQVNGMPLDFCLKKAGEDGGTECGEPPATGTSLFYSLIN
jgi:hypothetical protein